MFTSLTTYGTPLARVELITNGEFIADTDWTKSGGWTISSGSASCDGVVGDIEQSIAITSGLVYRITFDVLAGATFGGNNLRVILGSSPVPVEISTIGPQSIDITAGSSGTDLVFNVKNTNDFIGSVDNVSVL
jgi:hypothetical protein